MLKKNINPTFWAKVFIPTYEKAEGGFAEINVEFVYRDRNALSDFVSNLPKQLDVDIIMNIARSWTDVEGDFNAENVAFYCGAYHGFAKAMFDTYLAELTKERTKNYKPLQQ